MVCASKFAPVAAAAKAAREAIDARLREIPDIDTFEFWRVVSKIYARGLPEVPTLPAVASSVAAEVILQSPRSARF